MSIGWLFYRPVRWVLLGHDQLLGALQHLHSQRRSASCRVIEHCRYSVREVFLLDDVDGHRTLCSGVLVPVCVRSDRDHAVMLGHQARYLLIAQGFAGDGNEDCSRWSG